MFGNDGKQGENVAELGSELPQQDKASHGVVVVAIVDNVKVVVVDDECVNSVKTNARVADALTFVDIVAILFPSSRHCH